MKTVMAAAGVLVVFLGLVFIIGGRPLTGGIILVSGGFLAAMGLRKRTVRNVVVRRELELTGDVSLEDMKCRNCGGSLSADSTSLRDGALFVSCPYCHSEYQVEEAPKW